MNRSTKTLLLIGIAIGVIQLTSLTVMLFDIGPVALAVALKVALYTAVATFVVVGLRSVRRA